MATRRRIGDVYEIVDGILIGLVHHIGNDSTVPGSNVVDIIAPVSPDWAASFESLPRLFRAHVFLRAGETLDLWKVAGRREIPSQTTQRWCTVPPQDFGASTSVNWRVWMTDQPMANAQSPVDLAGAEFGYVMSPTQIVHRIRHGRYTHALPGIAAPDAPLSLMRKLFRG